MSALSTVVAPGTIDVGIHWAKRWRFMARAVGGEAAMAATDVLHRTNDFESKRKLALGYLDSLSAGGRRPPQGTTARAEASGGVVTFVAKPR